MIVTETDLLNRQVARMTEPAIKGTQLEFLDNICKRSIQAGRLSFRRVVQALVPLVAQKGK